jgi:hypothetical protein
LLSTIEEAHENIQKIAAAIVAELNMMTKGHGSTSDEEKLMRLQTNVLRGFISNTTKR